MIVARRLSRDRIPQAVAERIVSRDFGSFHDERAGRIRVRAARIDNAGRGAGARRENSWHLLRPLDPLLYGQEERSEGREGRSRRQRRGGARVLGRSPSRTGTRPGASWAPRQSQSLPRTGLAA